MVSETLETKGSRKIRTVEVDREEERRKERRRGGEEGGRDGQTD